MLWINLPSGILGDSFLSPGRSGLQFYQRATAGEIGSERRQDMRTRRLRRRPLTIREILAWASAHREATGKWPAISSGRVLAARFETWQGIDQALRLGLRDLPGGSSLPQLLEEQYGARCVQHLPPLTEEQILRWADEHHERTGSWPTAKKRGIIPGTNGERWNLIDQVLRKGLRSLPPGSSLAQLLAQHRAIRNRKGLPPFTEEQILQWADAFRRRTGAWPNKSSGPIAEAPGETWMAVEMAVRYGRRGIAGGSSLARMLAEKRGARNRRRLPNLSLEQILAWADAFQQRTGKWPGIESGPIPEAPGETWCAVNNALRKRSRGLKAGFSLADLLASERGVPNHLHLPRLRRQQILAWADAHRRRTGEWPTQQSGLIPESPGDTWMTIDAALNQGHRGLRPGSSLPRLLDKYRGRRNIQDLPPLTKRKILLWADKHHERTGQWPNRGSGPVVEAPGENWKSIDNALRQGQRGQPGGSSLRRLLVKKRGVRHPLRLRPLTAEQILRWAQLHVERTGSWPQYKSGPILDAPGETWAAVDIALRRGKRGLAGGSSLAILLEQHRFPHGRLVAISVFE
jgi:hypothetical protein